jgi:carboxyl-terminal processing protease
VDLADGREVAIHRGADTLAAAAPRRFETREMGEGLAYVRVPSFGNPAMEDSTLAFLERHADAPAVIVDVRGNGGGTTPTRLVRGLMDRPYRGFGQSTSFDIGLYSAYERINEIVPPGALDDYSRGYVEAFAEFDRPRLVFPGGVEEPGEPVYTGRLVILVDDGCASACEDFVLPFASSGRATLLGEATQGSTGQPYMWDFGNGMSFRVSAKRVVMPDGSRFEGVGIVPDEEIVPTAEDLRNGRDPVLERALEVAGGVAADAGR